MEIICFLLLQKKLFLILFTTNLNIIFLIYKIYIFFFLISFFNRLRSAFFSNFGSVLSISIVNSSVSSAFDFSSFGSDTFACLLVCACSSSNWAN